MNTSLLAHDITLTDGLLEAFRSRAPEHDRDGRYPADDLDDLRAIGWLGAAAPVELGGLGLNLVQLARAQRRLARFAPSTATVHVHAPLLGRPRQRPAPVRAARRHADPGVGERR